MFDVIPGPNVPSLDEYQQRTTFKANSVKESDVERSRVLVSTLQHEMDRVLWHTLSNVGYPKGRRAGKLVLCAYTVAVRVINGWAARVVRRERMRN